MEMEMLPSGTKLDGRYRVERVLGNGGFGHVYLAMDMQSGQPFAVKEYLVAGAGGKAQLEHEARVLSHLHHPSLPAFSDSFDERGRYYVVLSYIEGRDLTDCIRAARQRNEIVPLERVLTWLISICEAVTFLHSQHPPVIHRDIKPDNIRITPKGTAILVDLGNAKAAEDGVRTLLFIRHQGTPGYAPLEQYPGGTGTDTRSDVYALGGTLYFALTAHEPPSVSTRKQSSDQGLPDLPSLQEILEKNPPETVQDANNPKQFRLGVNKPSKPAPRHSRHLAQLGTLSSDLLNRLNLIIARAMSMDPWDRYQSVMELSSDLQRVKAALSSAPRQAPTPVERPFDPHSTQPDLPFLFEQIQNSQGKPPAPAQDNTRGSGKPAIQAPASDVSARCPRCQAPVTPTAAFCPQCGAPLNSPSPQNNQDDDKTLVISPPSAQERNASNASISRNTPGEGASAQSAPGPGMSSTKTQRPPNPNGAAPFIVRASTPQAPSQTSPRPFIQSGTQGTQPPVVIPGMHKTQQAPSPGPHNTPQSSISPTPIKNPMAKSQQRAGLPKGVLIFVIIIIVVIVIVGIFLLTRHGGSGERVNMTRPHSASFTASETQVFKNERIVSLCPVTAVAPTDPGIWQCHPGIPTPAGIAQRMDGTRTGSTAHDYRSRLTQAGILHSS